MMQQMIWPECKSTKTTAEDRNPNKQIVKQTKVISLKHVVTISYFL